MEKILDKLSEYEVLNSLIPGVVYVCLIKAFCKCDLGMGDIWKELALCYFAGLTISRIGSVCIEPLIKKLKIAREENYSNYINAGKKDDMIPVLIRVRNQYRSFSALAVLLAATKLIFKIISIFPNITTSVIWLCVLLTFVLFVASYVKQTNYIVRRVQSVEKETEQ